MTRRRGFTLAEILVTLAIAAILGVAIFAVNATSIVEGGSLDTDTRATEARNTLSQLADAIAALQSTNPASSFLQKVGAYPLKLSQLTTQITTADRNSCNRAGTDNYLSTAIPTAGPDAPGYTLGWGSPYFTEELPAAGGFELASGYVTQDQLVRTPSAPTGTGSGQFGTLAIRMPSVVRADALALETKVDGVQNGTKGTLRYGAGDPVQVDYILIVSGC
jgi:prepilin-type N-terminal cleavage/methylation domain-containing protein